MDDSLKHLDKIINILRCKKKFIFLKQKCLKNIQSDNLPTSYNAKDQSVTFYDKNVQITVKS